MSPERWERIKDVAFSAMEREGDARARFLKEACGTDEDLRRAVEELLEEHQRPGDTLAQAIGSVAADVSGPGARSNASMIGQAISHYKITEKLGQGGMGVVYKAEDTKLKRRVALKFLAHYLLQDEECRKRFEREATAAAAIDHPNICTVYEIDEIDGQAFIAMAYVEGQSLRQKIESHPLKIDEALEIARQTAQGLRAAHQREVVHRDIKPANLMVNSEGQVKIMDFGLARLAEHSRLTKTQTTMGTTAYMSPEQTMGADVDHRTDIWALGVVLYEMIIGQRPFKGHYDKAVMYSITNEDPEPLTALRSGVPMELEWILGKCLAKDADRRYQNAGDLAVDLKNLQDKLKSGRSTVLKTPWGTRHAAPSLSTWKRYVPWAVTAATALGLAALAFVHIRGTSPELPLRNFSYTPPAATGTQLWGRSPSVAVSPNGEHVAFVTGGPFTNHQLWIWDLARREPRMLAEGMQLTAPFWSPDSAHVAYAIWPGGPHAVWRVSVQGGPPSLVCEYKGGVFFGGTWSPDGEVIVFSHNLNGPGVLREVPAEGGTAKLLVPPEVSDTSERPSFRWPHFLPAEAGSRVLVYTEGGTLIVHDFATGQRETLGDGAFPAYSSSGQLVFQVSTTNPVLRAAPFSLRSLRFTGEIFLIRKNARYPSVARDGTLAYLELLSASLRQMVWRDRHGEKVGTIGQPQLNIGKPELSPDGKRVVAVSSETGNSEVWVHDIDRGVPQRLTFGPGADRPVWLPTGNEISFTSNRDSYVKSADGMGEEELLLTSPFGDWVLDWSADGKYGIFVQGNETLDLYYLKRKDNGSGYDPIPFIKSPDIWFESAKLSPNGKYLAYASNESGELEVHVQPFPQGGRVTTISTNGGRQPSWRGDGKELFYVEGNTVVAVPVTTDGEFSAGAPERLFPVEPGALDGPGHHYAVTPDGQKFIIVEGAEGEPAAAPSIQVTQNWFAEFRHRERN